MIDVAFQVNGSVICLKPIWMRYKKVLTPMFAIIVIIFAILMVSDYEALKPLIYAYVMLITLYTVLFYQVARHNKKLKNDIRD